MREMKDSGIDTIGYVPSQWVETRLKYLCKIQTGDEDTQNANPEGEYPFFVRSPIVERCDRYTFEGEGILVAGDGAGAGRIFHHVFGKYAVHQRVYRLSDFSYNAKFIHYYLSNLFPAEMDKGSAQSTVPSMRLPMLLNFKFYLPSNDEAKKIVDYLDKKCTEIDTLTSDIQKQIDTLEQYKKSVITEAVTKGLNPDAEMKDSGIDFIGKMPLNFKIVRVKNIGSARNGLTYTPFDLCDEQEGILVLRSSNVQNGQIVFKDNVYVKCNVPPKLIVQQGDILICSRNGSKELIGKNAIIDENINASFGAFMMIYRCNVPKYMYYILNSEIFKYYLGSFFTSTINQLTNYNFGNMKIPYCFDEVIQKQITDYLDKKCSEIDTIISDKKKQLEVIAEYKKSLIYEYVTGKKEVM